MRARAIALVVAAVCAAGGCASATAQPSSQPSPSPSPTATPAKPAAPSTATVTVTPSTSTIRVTQPPQTPVPAPTTPAQDPAAVVSAFYAAINAQDYAAAWNLGGDNLGFSYSAFAAGFAGTVHDSLTIVGEQGDTVQIHLEALQSDGSTKVYDGSYIVSNGQIVQGRLAQTDTIAPAS